MLSRKHTRAVEISSQFSLAHCQDVAYNFCVSVNSLFSCYFMFESHWYLHETNLQWDASKFQKILVVAFWIITTHLHMKRSTCLFLLFFSGQGNCFIVYAGGMHVAHGYTNTVDNTKLLENCKNMFTSDPEIHAKWNVLLFSMEIY